MRNAAGAMWSGLLALLLAGAAASPAAALQFFIVPDSDDIVLLRGVGEILPGDIGRLHRVMARVKSGQHIGALLLDSPGGSVRDAAMLAEAIHDDGLAVVIPSDSKCVSACFLLLAASPRRFAGSNAIIGVHSASVGGEETETALAVTTETARLAAGYGIPPVILGKMVQTPPEQVEWLTHADLVAMNVTLLPDGSNGANETRPAPPVAATTAPEYRGAVFCGDLPVALSLTLVGGAGAAGQAIIGFGPTATNPQMPAGSFVAGGRFDRAGGMIDLHPATWLVQPAGFAITGLLGRSDDGGRIFVGRITAAPESCSVFTLRRAG